MEDIAFLGICLGGPVLMVLAFAWLAFGAAREWWAVRSLGWEVVSDDDVQALLQSAPTLSNCAFTRPRRQSDVVAVTTRTQVKGGTRGQTTRTTTHLVIWPVPGVGRGLIARRTGGLLERTVERFAPTLTAPESWSWARIHGPVDPSWLTDERGRALGEALTDDLYLLGDHVGLTGNRQSTLMRQADALRSNIESALRTPSA